MKIVLVLLNLLSVLSLAAQPVSVAVIDNDLQVKFNTQLQLRYLPVAEFKVLEWHPGYAYYQDGSSRSYEGLRFNLPENKAEVNLNKQIFELLPGVITGFSMGEESSLSHIFVNVPLEEPLFMELLVPGKADLLVVRIVTVKHDEPEKGIVTTITFDEREEIIKYKENYYVWSKGIIQRYKPNKKFILEVMSDQSERIQQYLKTNNTRLKNTNQMIALFDYYNSL